MHWDQSDMLTTTALTCICTQFTQHEQQREANSRANTTMEPPICQSAQRQAAVSCVVMVMPPDDTINWLGKKNGPPYPLSPTRCWRYHFSYLDFGGDCGLGRCKRPAEARCLPPFQSLRLGSRKLNPLLDSHTQKYTSIEITHDPQPNWGAGVQGGHRSVLDGDLWRLKTKGVLWLVEAKSHWQII